MVSKLNFNLSKVEEERAREIHNKSIIIDAKHVGPAVYTDKIIKRVKELSKGNSPGWLVQGELYKLVISESIENPDARRRYINDVKASGVTAISTTLPSGDRESGKGQTWEGALTAPRNLVSWDYWISNLSEILMKAESAEDIRRAKKEGKLSIIYDFQDTIHLGNNLDNIDFFYNLGVRIIQLTYNMMNLVGVGCTEKYERECGLSNFGHRLVERLNKLGILVDLSHCGYKTTLDAVEASVDTVVATHTACKALCNNPRAKTDEELKAIAESGGFIGIHAVGCFYSEENRNINHFLDQIDYAVKVAGVDHIAIGQDQMRNCPWPDDIIEEMRAAKKSMAGGYGWPTTRTCAWTPMEGMADFTEWINITRGLVSRGYSDQEIKKIIGENFLSVFEKIVG